MFWVWLINFTDIESLYERCTTRSNRCSFLDTHEMENDKFKSIKFLLKNEALNWNRSHAEINLFLLLFCKKKRNEMKRKSKLTIKVSEVDGFEHLDLIVSSIHCQVEEILWCIFVIEVLLICRQLVCGSV